MRTSDITINTSILDSGLNSTDIDFSNIVSANKDDYFELHLDEDIIKITLFSNMTIEKFVEWITMNCNAKSEFYAKASATANSNILNITTRSSDTMKIDLDYNRI
tara:strand:+ start:6465 stop:6779 length:315 start_codon:yes stop_codon:yes gene_type:complete